MRPGDRERERAGETGREGSEKRVTESKMEMKTFAELRVVALRPDREEMDPLTGREITP